MPLSRHGNRGRARPGPLGGRPLRPLRAPWLTACVALALAAAPSRAGAEEGGLRLAVENVSVLGEFVVFDIVMDGAYDESERDALRRGFVTKLTYTVELWRERRLWFDKLELSRTLTLRVEFDPWKERYTVSFRRDRAAKYESLEEVEEATSRLRGLRLVRAAELQPGSTYYIVAKAVLRPITVEEVDEVEDWLRGKPGGKESPLSLPRYLARALLGTTGISDRSAEARSESFTVEPVE